MLSVAMLSVTMLSVVMLNVVMLSIVMLSVIMLSVIMLNVVMLSVVMLNVVMLSVVMSSVVAQGLSFLHDQSFFKLDHNLLSFLSYFNFTYLTSSFISAVCPRLPFCERFVYTSDLAVRRLKCVSAQKTLPQEGEHSIAKEHRK